jgi:GT2 family glycosyltransferase
MTLAGVATQTMRDLRVIISDQSGESVADVPEVLALRRSIKIRGGSVEWHRRVPSRGIAEQRDFLLRQATSDYVLYLDDDVLMESWVVERLLRTIRENGCGFVGAFPAQPAYVSDSRPHHERIEYWHGHVEPETINPGDPEWSRASLHSAANLLHVSQRLGPGEHRLYKVAWLGACVLYDRQKLADVGGYSFWPRLQRHHAGEDVLVQNLLLRRWGGCGIIPSGTYFSEVPSTVPDQARSSESHALALLPELIERYAPGTLLPAEDAHKYW